MRTTTEEAAEIRRMLKTRYHWTSRQVSVRTEYFSLGSAIRVEINDPAVPLAAVQAVAKPAEHINYDTATGEILGGGNTYLTIAYSREAQVVIARRYVDDVQRAIDAVEPGSSALAPVAEISFFVGRPAAWRLTLWEGSRYVCDRNSAEDVAYVIGMASI